MALIAGEIAVDLTAEIDNLKKRVNEAKGVLDDYERSADASAVASSTLFKRVQTGALVAVGALTAAAAAFAAVRAASLSAIESADAIGDVAESAGLSAEALQELRFAVRATGGEAKEADRGFATFKRRLDEARVGEGQLARVLGVTNAELLKQVTAAQDTDRALTLILEALKNTREEADKAALAQAAFGASGEQIQKVAEDGAAGVGRLRDEARDLGRVLDEETIAQASELQDRLDRVGTSLRVDVTRALVAVGPIFVSLAENIARAADAVGDFFDRFRDDSSLGAGALARRQAEVNAQLIEVANQLRAAEGNRFFRNEGQIQRLRQQLDSLERRRAELTRALDQITPDPRRGATPPPGTDAGRDAAAEGAAGAAAAARTLRERRRAEREAERERRRRERERETAEARLLRLTQQRQREEAASLDPLLKQVEVYDQQLRALEEIRAKGVDVEEVNAEALAIVQRREAALDRLGDLQTSNVEKEAEAERIIGRIAQLDAEVARQLERQLALRLAGADGAEATAAALERFLVQIRGREDALTPDPETIQERFVEPLRDGIAEVLTDGLRGEQIDFGQTLGDLGAQFLRDNITELLNDLGNSFKELLDELSEGAGGIFDGEAGGRLGRSLGAALGIGLTLASRAFQDTETDVQRARVQSAVTSTRRVRGVAAGDTSIPIAEAERVFDEALQEGNALSRRTNAILLRILSTLNGNAQGLDASEADLALQSTALA